MDLFAATLVCDLGRPLSKDECIRFAADRKSVGYALVRTMRAGGYPEVLGLMFQELQTLCTAGNIPFPKEIVSLQMERIPEEEPASLVEIVPEFRSVLPAGFVDTPAPLFFGETKRSSLRQIFGMLFLLAGATGFCFSVLFLLLDGVKPGELLCNSIPSLFAALTGLGVYLGKNG